MSTLRRGGGPYDAVAIMSVSRGVARTTVERAILREESDLAPCRPRRSSPSQRRLAAQCREIPRAFEGEYIRNLPRSRCEQIADDGARRVDARAKRCWCTGSVASPIERRARPQLVPRDVRPGTRDCLIAARESCAASPGRRTDRRRPGTMPSTSAVWGPGFTSSPLDSLRPPRPPTWLATAVNA